MPSLRALLDSDVEVLAVVTNPDRPAGRKLEPRPPPVKEAALAAGLKVLQPGRARDPDLRAELQQLAPDVVVVVAYGKILPPDLLAVPPHGFVNVHFSLLPLYRGAAPVQRALMEGASETGVSIMVLTEGMDEGPVIATRSLAVDPDENAGELGDRLAASGAELLVPSLHGYVAGRMEPRPQDDDRATYAPKLEPHEERIDWHERAESLHNLVRALSPAPGAWTTLRGGRVKVYGTRVAGDGDLAPGEVQPGRELVVGTGAGALELVSVQPAGKRRMSGAELLRGLRPGSGERFE